MRLHSISEGGSGSSKAASRIGSGVDKSSLVVAEVTHVRVRPSSHLIVNAGLDMIVSIVDVALVADSIASDEGSGKSEKDCFKEHVKVLFVCLIGEDDLMIVEGLSSFLYILEIGNGGVRAYQKYEGRRVAQVC